MNTFEKVMCQECNWIGKSSELLTAINPFDESSIITGCPNCKNIETIRVCCDEPECQREATCGTPINDGYRHTCNKHCPSILG